VSAESRASFCAIAVDFVSCSAIDGLKMNCTIGSPSTSASMIDSATRGIARRRFATRPVPKLL
jgi:hypothetical protein